MSGPWSKKFFFSLNFVPNLYIVQVRHNFFLFWVMSRTACLSLQLVAASSREDTHRARKTFVKASASQQSVVKAWIDVRSSSPPWQELRENPIIAPELARHCIKSQSPRTHRIKAARRRWDRLVVATCSQEFVGLRGVCRSVKESSFIAAGRGVRC